jgi:pilus assembly protein Flp/PilA
MHRFSKFTSAIAGQARAFTCDESGATAIEYAMIASGIAVAIVAAVSSLGTATQGLFGTVTTAVK